MSEGPFDQDDPRVSDEATGLPPLEEVEDDLAMLVVAWYASEGVAASPLTNEPQAVRYLHARGLVTGKDGTPEWAQVYLAVPVEASVELAAALAKGTTEQL